MKTRFLPVLLLLLSMSVSLPVAYASDNESENESEHPVPILYSSVPSDDTEVEADSYAEVRFVGQVIELSSTDAPTTVIVREHPEGEFTDWTVNIDSLDAIKGTPMTDWITGDFVNVEGKKDENTGVVTATSVRNVSIDSLRHKGMNGWVSAIDTSASTMDVKWQDQVSKIHISAETRLVVPPNTKATLSDFKIGDRVRLRLNKESDLVNDARIVVALRRGDEVFLKARTRGFKGTLGEINTDAKTMTVTLHGNLHLKGNDVNNLVGVEGEIITVAYDDNTKIVRRYKGASSVDEMVQGDELFVVGRVGDDGVVTARTIKDNSLMKKNVAARAVGEITAVDPTSNTLTVVLKSGGASWKVSYTDATQMKRNGAKAVETDFKVGDRLRWKGVVNLQARTVVATDLFATAKQFKPLKRVRDMKDIIQKRIKTSLGKMSEQEIVLMQRSEDAED